MDEHQWLAEQFEAEDAVQESWLHLSRSDTRGVENLGGWLTTVVARICLDMLRSRNSRREEPLDASVPEPITREPGGIDPEQEALLADSVGLALLVVLDTLSPAERLAFVLHDIFAMPFDEIARVVERSPTATRQLASRARRRVRGAATVKDPISPQAEKWSTPSSPPRAAVTSRRCSPCSIRTSSSDTTAQLCLRARQGRFVVRLPWPGSFQDVPREHDRLS